VGQVCRLDPLGRWDFFCCLSLCQQSGLTVGSK
jgi:hypothetical protein